jgi:PAS domain S-box-containing protein
VSRAQAVPLRPRPPQLWRFLLIALLVPTTLAALAGWTGLEYGRAEALRESARRAADRQIEMVRTLAQLADAETSQRGFVITGDERFLELYAPARRRVEVKLHGMMRDVAGEERARLERLRGVAAAKFAEMDRVLAARRAGGLNAAAPLVASGEGKRLMDAARVLAADVVAAEERRERQRVSAFDARTRRIRSLSWVTVIGVALVLALGLWRLRRERQRGHETELRAYEAAVRQRILFESTVDAIAVLNPSGSIETLNPAAMRLLGYERDELMQRDVSTIFELPRTTGSFHERIGYAHGVLATSFLPDRVVRHRDGSELPVDVALGVMKLPDGDHIILSIRDIAERKRVEQIKDDLVSTISHELRTPLTSIVGALGLLRTPAAGRLPDAAAQLVGIAEANSTRLIRLINDMLDIDRIDAGKLKIERTRLDLRALVKRGCSASRGLGTHGVTIECALPDQPLHIEGDPDRLLQVVANLASNAVRLSPPGAEVRIALTREDDVARVVVDDRGPGVPEEFRSRIFGRFERAAEQDTSGTGLGLAISREIIEQHGGAIGFEDRPGGGTRFSFTIPLPLHSDGDRPRVLICAADQSVAARLTGLADGEGYASVVVDSAARARAMIASEPFGAALVDVSFSTENGLPLARALRDDADRSGLPIIVLAASGDAPLDESAHVDFLDWLEEPLDAARLAEAIRVGRERLGISPPTILHLEDDRDLLAVTAAALGAEARILTARNLDEARAILARQEVDIAIIDIHLEDGVGLDLLPALVDRAGVAIPTVIYSAQRVPAEAAGRVDATLIKAPGSIPNLKATIRRILHQRRVTT